MCVLRGPLPIRLLRTDKDNATMGDDFVDALDDTASIESFELPQEDEFDDFDELAGDEPI